MKRFIILLGMTVFFFLATSVYGQVHTITISKDPDDPNKLKVNPTLVIVNFDSGDLVEWVLDPNDFPAGTTFEVYFIGKNNAFFPWRNHRFGNGNGLENRTRRPIRRPQGVPGDPKGGAQKWNYMVSIDGYEDLDPGIIIWD